MKRIIEHKLFCDYFYLFFFSFCAKRSAEWPNGGRARGRAKWKTIGRREEMISCVHLKRSRRKYRLIRRRKFHTRIRIPDTESDKGDHIEMIDAHMVRREREGTRSKRSNQQTKNRNEMVWWNVCWAAVLCLLVFSVSAPIASRDDIWYQRHRSRRTIPIVSRARDMNGGVLFFPCSIDRAHSFGGSYAITRSHSCTRSPIKTMRTGGGHTLDKRKRNKECPFACFPLWPDLISPFAAHFLCLGPRRRHSTGDIHSALSPNGESESQ